MIEKVSFSRFRGFARLHVNLAPHAYIVGPNSAGKSTLLEAIALAELCLQRARRVKPTSRRQHAGTIRDAYPLPPSLDDEDDPVRFEFGSSEAHVSVQWESGATIHLVWPDEDDDKAEFVEPTAGYFYLTDSGNTNVRLAKHASTLFPPVLVVPVITPLDRVEEIKNETYVKSRRTNRLASRHFRNHLLHLSRTDEWQKFRSFCAAWCPELELQEVQVDYASNRLSVFYIEEGSRVPKELAWAGDGLQIWIQILWHIYFAVTGRPIVLDEPDVYLHPHLQRRLVRLLKSTESQIILASHSADIVAEAPSDGILWVDRKRNSATRAKSTSSLTALTESLGSSFSISLARSLRARIILVTNSAPEVMRIVAGKIGATTLANENATEIISLPGDTSPAQLFRSAKDLKNLLPAEAPLRLVLESNHEDPSWFAKHAYQIADNRTSIQTWVRPELTNYILDPSAIAKAAGAASETVAIRIAEIISRAQLEYRALYIKSRQSQSRGPYGSADILASEFDLAWGTDEGRLSLISGGNILRTLNTWFEKDGYSVVTPKNIAARIRPEALDNEIFNVLLAINNEIEEST